MLRSSDRPVLGRRRSEGDRLGAILNVKTAMSHGLDEEVTDPRGVTAVLAYAGTAWVTLAHHLGAGVPVGPQLLVDVLRDGTLVLPLLLMVVTTAATVGGIARAAMTGVGGALVLGTIAPAHSLLTLGSGLAVEGHQHTGEPLLAQLLASACVALALSLPVAAAQGGRRAASRGKVSRGKVLRLAAGRGRLVTTAWLALAAGGVLHLVHRAEHERHALNPARHWLRDSGLSLPVALAAVVVAEVVTHRVRGWLRSGGPDR